MAAGKINVSKRGDISSLSNGTLNRFAGVYNVELKNSGGLNFGDKGVVGVEYDVRRRPRDGDFFFCGDVQARGKRAMAVDDETVSPPEKSRKISLVSLNGEQNWSPVHGHSSLTQDFYLADDQEPGQLDEDDFSNAPNIFTSRWAYDDDVDEGIRNEKGSKQEEDMKGRRSSPESGVTQKEESDSSGVRSGLVLRSYNDDGSSENEVDNDYCMAIDARGYEDSSAEDLDFDSGDGLKAGNLEHGRNMLQACRSVFEYEKLGKINEGSYGIVYKAQDKKTGEMVALKKLKMGDNREGFPLYYLREINTLLSLNHPSIVNVREVVVDESFEGFDNIYLTMDFVEHDLKALIQARKQPFSQSEVKCLMLQLLEGVQYLHDNWVLHRDLKTSNLLLNNKGELKICDFGMSRQYGNHLNPYTALVVTLWYRAPELLLGVKEYSTAVDMWSVGCIMAELLLGKPLMDGKTELEQLNKIFRTLGTPNDNIWPGCSQLRGVKANLVHQPYSLLHKKFPRASFTGSVALSDLGLDLLSKLLTYDPAKRITAEEALNHRWFQEVPLPKSKDFMPTFPVDKVALAR